MRANSSVVSGLPLLPRATNHNKLLIISPFLLIQDPNQPFYIVVRGSFNRNCFTLPSSPDFVAAAAVALSTQQYNLRIRDRTAQWPSYLGLGPKLGTALQFFEVRRYICIPIYSLYIFYNTGGIPKWYMILGSRQNRLVE